MDVGRSSGAGHFGDFSDIGFGGFSVGRDFFDVGVGLDVFFADDSLRVVGFEFFCVLDYVS